MTAHASLPPTQALRIVPGSLPRFSASATDRSPPWSPPKVAGLVPFIKMDTALARRLLGGLRLLAKRPMATATRIATGNKPAYLNMK